MNYKIVTIRHFLFILLPQNDDGLVYVTVDFPNDPLNRKKKKKGKKGKGKGKSKDTKDENQVLYTDIDFSKTADLNEKITAEEAEAAREAEDARGEDTRSTDESLAKDGEPEMVLDGGAADGDVGKRIGDTKPLFGGNETLGTTV